MRAAPPLATSARLTLIAMLVFVLVAPVAASAQGIHIGFDWSRFERLGPEAVRVRNLAVPGQAGTFWVDFQWDPSGLVLVPVNFGAEEPHLTETERLRGTWHFIYTIGSSVFTDDYMLTRITGQKNSQGGLFIVGTNEWGDGVSASYLPADGQWSLYDPGFSPSGFGQYYVFHTDGQKILPGGCYYFTNGGTITSPCYPLTGQKRPAADPGPPLP